MKTIASLPLINTNTESYSKFILTQRKKFPTYDEALPSYRAFLW